MTSCESIGSLGLFLRTSRMLWWTSGGVKNTTDCEVLSCRSLIAAVHISVLTYSKCLGTIVQTLNCVILCLTYTKCQSSTGTRFHLQIRAPSVSLVKVDETFA